MGLFQRITHCGAPPGSPCDAPNVKGPARLKSSAKLFEQEATEETEKSILCFLCCLRVELVGGERTRKRV